MTVRTPPAAGQAPRVWPRAAPGAALGAVAYEGRPPYGTVISSMR